MRLSIDSFRGEIPRLTARALPANAAQSAINCRLVSGDLEPWRQFLLTERLGHVPSTIYLLNGAWLSWTTDVDVARGIIPGDTSYRIYLTGPDEYDQPRWTDFSLAVQSPGGPYPVVTRPVGVPDPDAAPTLQVGVDSTPTTFSVDITDDNASLATDWSINPPLNSNGRVAIVSQGVGFYQVDYDENRDPGQEAYAYRNFGVGEVSVLRAEVQIQFGNDSGVTEACMTAGASSTGEGPGLLYINSSFGIRQQTSWGCLFTGVTLASTGIALAHSTPYKMRMDVTTNEDGSKTVRGSLYDVTGTTELATVTATNNFGDGGYCGFANGAIADAGSIYTTYYSDYHVQGSGSTNVVAVNVATSYVYTLVNDLGEQSAPSPASATVLRPDGVSVTVTTPTGLPSGISTEYGIESKRIYRGVTGATGSIFRLVAELDLSTEDYVDTLTDAQLGEELESEGWELPPEDLRGILALPNGIMVGFRRNQLCFSAQNRPHAWPVDFRLNTDTDIVAIGNIDTTVVVATKSFPYLASGATPGDFTMSKLEVPQACTSKRSLAYLIGIGVVFSSPDGMMAVAGTGQVRNLTGAVFTREQWQALAPETIMGIAHDDVFHFWFDPADGDPAGYALDMKADGSGVVELAYHATAVHADPLTDNLYLVLDENNEPTTPYLPEPSTAPIPDGRTIYQFDGDQTSNMVYRYRGRLNLLPSPGVPQVCRVQAQDHDNLIVRGYGDGDLHFEQVSVSDEEFTLPMLDEFSIYEQELVGTSRVRRFQVAESIEEID